MEARGTLLVCDRCEEKTFVAGKINDLGFWVDEPQEKKAAWLRGRFTLCPRCYKRFGDFLKEGKKC